MIEARFNHNESGAIVSFEITGHAGYADMGQTEDSIHADGVVDGLKQALDIVQAWPDGRDIFF